MRTPLKGWFWPVLTAAMLTRACVLNHDHNETAEAAPPPVTAQVATADPVTPGSSEDYQLRMKVDRARQSHDEAIGATVQVMLDQRQFDLDRQAMIAATDRDRQW